MSSEYQSMDAKGSTTPSNGKDDRRSSKSSDSSVDDGDRGFAGKLGSIGMNGVFIALTIICATGCLFIWFETDFVNTVNPNSKHMVDFGSIATSLTICVVGFALSVCPNFFIPTTHSGPVKRFCLFLILAYLDQHICMTRYLYKDWDLDRVTKEQKPELNTVRLGSVLIIFAVLPAFLIAFLFPGSTGGVLAPSKIKERFLSLRGIINLVTAILMLLATFVMWGVNDPCNYAFSSQGSSDYIFIRIASTLLIAILLITSTISDDKGTQDYLLFIMVHQLVSATPLFPETLYSADQSNFKHVVRAENALFFIATLVYVLGFLVERIKVYAIMKAAGMIEGAPGIAGIKEKVKTPAFIVSIFFVLLSMTAAIMMSAWSQKDITKPSMSVRQANFVGWLAFVCVVLNMVASLLKFSFASILSLLIAFNVVPILAAYTSATKNLTDINLSSYFRAGAILQILIVVLTQLLSLANVPKKRIDELFSNPSAEGNEARQGPSASFAFFIWSLAACYSWQETTILYWYVPNAAFVIFPIVVILGALDLFGRQSPEVQRVVSIQCAWFIINPGLWPISVLAAPTFGKVFTLLAALITFGIYSWNSPGGILNSFHDQVEGDLSGMEGSEGGPNLANMPDDERKPLASSAPSDGGTFRQEA